MHPHHAPCQCVAGPRNSMLFGLSSLMLKPGPTTPTGGFSCHWVFETFIVLSSSSLQSISLASKRECWRLASGTARQGRTSGGMPLSFLAVWREECLARRTLGWFVGHDGRGARLCLDPYGAGEASPTDREGIACCWRGTSLHSAFKENDQAFPFLRTSNPFRKVAEISGI